MVPMQKCIGIFLLIITHKKSPDFGAFILITDVLYWEYLALKSSKFDVSSEYILWKVWTLSRSSS